MRGKTEAAAFPSRWGCHCPFDSNGTRPAGAEPLAVEPATVPVVRIQARAKERTPQRRAGVNVDEVAFELNSVLHGRGLSVGSTGTKTLRV